MSHLTPSQLWHRARYTARRALWTQIGSRLDDRYRSRAASLGGARFDHPGLARVAALRCARTRADASLAIARDALAGRFCLLNETRELGVDVDWQRADLDVGTRLWKTQLHEFAWAIELARAARDRADATFRERFEALLASWAASARIGAPGSARDVWNARAVANRIIHWSIAASILRLEPSDPLHARLREQLGAHALFLRDNLELDLRGNHLLRDCVGLLFADAVLGAAPEALERLRAQVGAQLLADGCHVERAPLYHAWVLQDLVECRELLGDAAPGWLREAVSRMAAFLDGLLPPSRALPLFGDSWRGDIDPDLLLEQAGAARARASRCDPAQGSGLVALCRGEAHAVFRAGPHGPDQQLGHAHADGLSFELYCGSAQWITDSGTRTYDAGALRDRLRSTAAHNTVQLDGEEQLEAWGSFRVGRRGRGRVVAWGAADAWEWIWAVHDGYRWLAGRPLHERLLAVSPNALIALDAVTGGGRHAIRSALHLHPDLPRERVAIAALRGEIQQIEVALHERFNESRPMAEWFVECEAALPWFGGWGIAWELGGAPLAFELRETATGCRLEWEGPAARSVSWNLKARSVEFGAARAAHSAT
ncbi:MAG TPA: alginate lyase family protein [Myxococcota bacterium]|nr:alginate lyase family protein [Myxococcota bacterium]